MTDAGQRTNAWAAFGRPAPGPGPSLVAPAKGTAPCRHCGDTVLPAPCPVLRSHVSSDRNKQVSGKQGRDARCSRTHGTSGKRADRCHSGRNGRLSLLPALFRERGRGPTDSVLLPQTRSPAAGPCHGPLQPSGLRGRTVAPSTVTQGRLPSGSPLAFLRHGHPARPEGPAWQSERRGWRHTPCHPAGPRHTGTVPPALSSALLGARHPHSRLGV